MRIIIMAIRIARAVESTTREVADEGAMLVNMSASMPERGRGGKQVFTQ